jgi:peptidoglycan/LPS O-acetylase OafA/YrhL
LPRAAALTACESQSGWRAAGALRPLLALGRNSYEVYLTHMFVVLGLFGLFVKFGKPMLLVPVLFVVTIILATMLDVFHLWR